jgi:hypothetical protein
MKVRPEFFAWTPERQERYGVSMTKEDEAAFDHALLAELFGRRYITRTDAVEAARDLTTEEQHVWNETLLPLHGIGEDCFYLHEWLGEGVTILDFPTLRDYDEADHRAQEQARQRENPAHVPAPYRGALYLRWARLFIDGKFTYATLSMAAGYLYTELDSVAHDLIEQRIPHCYVPGKDHGKPERDGWRWDMRIDAHGQEDILDDLQLSVAAYTTKRHDALRTQFDAANACAVYTLSHPQPPEEHAHFLFTDKSALASIRLRSFVRDCRALERPLSDLIVVLESERAALSAFIDSEHVRLLRDYDPQVVRPRDRRKVIIMSGAFGGTLH